MEHPKPRFNIDFIKYRRAWFFVSIFLVFVSIALFVGIGPNWGIEFTGGTEILMKFEDPIEIGELRKAMDSLGIGNDAVQQIGAAEDQTFVVRIQDPTFGTA